MCSRSSVHNPRGVEGSARCGGGVVKCALAFPSTTQGGWRGMLYVAVLFRATHIMDPRIMNRNTDRTGFAATGFQGGPGVELSSRSLPQVRRLRRHARCHGVFVFGQRPRHPRVRGGRAGDLLRRE